MKRFFIIAIAAIMLLSLAACGQDETDPTVTDVNAVTEAAEITEAAADMDAEEPGSDAAEDDTDTPAEDDVNTAETQTAVQINIDKLKEIEENDYFEVRITDKEFVRDADTGAMVLDGRDLILLTVANYTSADITDVTCLIASYTADNELKKLTQGAMFTYSGDPYVLAITSEEGAVIAPGESYQAAFKCDINDITGVRAIVASYRTADGEVHENSQAVEWYKNVQVERTTVLD